MGDFYDVDPDLDADLFGDTELKPYKSSKTKAAKLVRFVDLYSPLVVLPLSLLTLPIAIVLGIWRYYYYVPFEAIRGDIDVQIYSVNYSYRNGVIHFIRAEITCIAHQTLYNVAFGLCYFFSMIFVMLLPCTWIFVLCV